VCDKPGNFLLVKDQMLISPDPALFVDGPNLYAFSHNYPLHYLDRFGLNSENRHSEEFEDYFYGEVETHCFCERHRTCKRGSDLGKIYGPEAAIKCIFSRTILAIKFFGFRKIPKT